MTVLEAIVSHHRHRSHFFYQNKVIFTRPVSFVKNVKLKSNCTNAYSRFSYTLIKLHRLIFKHLGQTSTETNDVSDFLLTFLRITKQQSNRCRPKKLCTCSVNSIRFFNVPTCGNNRPINALSKAILTSSIFSGKNFVPDLIKTRLGV